MSNINVLVIFETKPESAQDFSALLEKISKELSAVNGCIHAQARVCTDNPQQFMIFEEWRSKDAHKAHIETVVSSGAWDKIAQHLAAAPITHYYQQL